jgi:hypothetical protein
MAEIVNLNRARKASVRADKQAQAAANRTKHGRTKAEKARDKVETERHHSTLDGAKRSD